MGFFWGGLMQLLAKLSMDSVSGGPLPAPLVNLRWSSSCDRLRLWRVRGGAGVRVQPTGLRSGMGARPGLAHSRKLAPEYDRHSASIPYMLTRRTQFNPRWAEDQAGPWHQLGSLGYLWEALAMCLNLGPDHMSLCFLSVLLDARQSWSDS